MSFLIHHQAGFQASHKKQTQKPEYSRCHQCGEYYELTEEWSNATVCSEECWTAYNVYLLEVLEKRNR